MAGIGAVGAAMTGRWAWRTYKAMQRTAQLTGTSPFLHYYRGGFESKMTRREAQLILGLRETTAGQADAIREAHRRIMIANHPDRGGSPYLATKVNEAKDLLMKETGGK